MMRFTSVCILTVLLATAVTGCKEATLEPELFGDLEGQVLDAATNEPIHRANITTNPSTSAITTDEDGWFYIDEVEDGNYTVNASKNGYKNRTVNVRVRENRTTTATILMDSDEDEAASNRSLNVEVNNWQNIVEGDTTRVRVEWRAFNTGNDTIPEYEIDFRIEGENSTFYHQEHRENLQKNQTDVGEFEKLILNQQATDVAVDRVWFEGQEDGDEQ